MEIFNEILQVVAIRRVSSRCSSTIFLLILFRVLRTGTKTARKHKYWPKEASWTFTVKINKLLIQLFQFWLHRADEYGLGHAWFKIFQNIQILFYWSRDLFPYHYGTRRKSKFSYFWSPTLRSKCTRTRMHNMYIREFVAHAVWIPLDGSLSDVFPPDMDTHLLFLIRGAGCSVAARVRHPPPPPPFPVSRGERNTLHPRGEDLFEDKPTLEALIYDQEKATAPRDA